MLGANAIILAIALLTMLSVGGLAYAMLATRIRDEGQIESRLAGVQAKSAALSPTGRVSDAMRRRKSIQDTLKEIEVNQKAKAKRNNSPPLMLKLQQAGLDWSRRTFILISFGAAAAFGLIALIAGLPLYAVAAAAIGAAQKDENRIKVQQTIPVSSLLDLANGRTWSIRTRVKDGCNLFGCSRDYDWELTVQAWGCADRLPETK